MVLSWHWGVFSVIQLYQDLGNSNDDNQPHLIKACHIPEAILSTLFINSFYLPNNLEMVIHLVLV